MPRRKNWTAEEWATSRDIHAMLRYIEYQSSRRQRQLFSCGWCRQVWGRFTEPGSRQAIEVGERFADGRATEEERAEAQRNALTVQTRWSGMAMAAVVIPSSESPARALGSIAFGRTQPSERTVQLAMVRCVFGNPFRPVTVDPRWLTSDVVALARGIYEDQAFDHLPVLADALQDAGCEDEQILAHCRGPGSHVRGCWVVDLLTGRV